MLAILLAEVDAPTFRDLMRMADRALVSAGTAVEFAVVASRDDDLFAVAMAFLSEHFIDVEPVNAAQATIAAVAYRCYGKGHHPVGLNLGDIFAYALAHERRVSLLFKGDDFSQTDIEDARGSKAA